MRFGKGISTKKSVMSNEECQIYRQDSIFVQPMNKPIQKRSVNDVIDDGIKKMSSDNFDLAEEFDDV